MAGVTKGLVYSRDIYPSKWTILPHDYISLALAVILPFRDMFQSIVSFDVFVEVLVPNVAVSFDLKETTLSIFSQLNNQPMVAYHSSFVGWMPHRGDLERAS